MSFDEKTAGASCQLQKFNRWYSATTLGTCSLPVLQIWISRQRRQLSKQGSGFARLAAALTQLNNAVDDQCLDAEVLTCPERTL
jgi:hypothetical protein